MRVLAIPYRKRFLVESLIKLFALTGIACLLCAGLSLPFPLQERVVPRVILFASPSDPAQKQFFEKVQDELVSLQRSVELRNERFPETQTELDALSKKLSERSWQYPQVLVSATDSISTKFALSDQLDFKSLREQGACYFQLDETSWTAPAAYLSQTRFKGAEELTCMLVVQHCPRFLRDDQLIIRIRQKESLLNSDDDERQISLERVRLDLPVTEATRNSPNTFCIPIRDLPCDSTESDSAYVDLKFKNFRADYYESIDLEIKRSDGTEKRLYSFPLWDDLKTLYVPLATLVHYPFGSTQWDKYLDRVKQRDLPLLEYSNNVIRLTPLTSCSLRECSILDRLELESARLDLELSNYNRLIIDVSSPKGIHEPLSLTPAGEVFLRLTQSWAREADHQALLLGEGQLFWHVESIVRNEPLPMFEDITPRQCVFAFDRSESAMNGAEVIESRLLTVPFSEPPLQKNEDKVTQSFRQAIFLPSMESEDFQDEEALRQALIQFDSKSELAEKLIEATLEELDYSGFHVSVNGELKFPPRTPDEEIAISLRDPRSGDKSKFSVDSIEERALRLYAKALQDASSIGGTQCPTLFAIMDGDDPGLGDPELLRNKNDATLDEKDTDEASGESLESLVVLSLSKPNKLGLNLTLPSSQVESKIIGEPYRFIRRVEICDEELRQSFFYGGRGRLAKFVKMIVADRLLSQRIDEFSTSFFSLPKDASASKNVRTDLNPLYLDRINANLLHFGKTPAPLAPLKNAVESVSKNFTPTQKRDTLRLERIGEGRLILFEMNTFATHSLEQMTFPQQAIRWDDWALDTQGHGTDLVAHLRVLSELEKSAEIKFFKIDPRKLLPESMPIKVKATRISAQFFAGNAAPKPETIREESAGSELRVTWESRDAGMLRLEIETTNDVKSKFVFFVPQFAWRLQETENWNETVLLTERLLTDHKVSSANRSQLEMSWHPLLENGLATPMKIHIPISNDLAPFFAVTLSSKLRYLFEIDSCRNWMLSGMIMLSTTLLWAAFVRYQRIANS